MVVFKFQVILLRTDSTAISFGSEALSTTGNITRDISHRYNWYRYYTYIRYCRNFSNTIRSTDSALLTVNDSLTVNNTLKSGVTSINLAVLLT